MGVCCNSKYLNKEEVEGEASNQQFPVPIFGPQVSQQIDYEHESQMIQNQCSRVISKQKQQRRRKHQIVRRSQSDGADNSVNVPLQRQLFKFSSDYNIDNQYTIQKTLQSRSSPNMLFLIKNKHTRQKFVLRQLPKSLIKSWSDLKDQIEKLQNLDHPNVVQIKEVYLKGEFINIITEYCRGPQVITINSQYFTENQAAIIMQQLFAALGYLQSQNISYSNLRQTKVRYATNKSDSVLKILNVHHILLNQSTNLLSSVSKGEIIFYSPEEIKGQALDTSNVWACGIFLYIMLSGLPPFDGRTTHAIQSKIFQGQVSFQSTNWMQISKSSQDLIRSMLQKNQSLRPSFQTLINSQWIREYSYELSDQSKQKYFNQFLSFNPQSNFQIQALQYVASLFQDQNLQKLFIELDKDCDGKLTVMDLQQELNKLGLDYTKAQQIVNIIDSDQSGQIEFIEFVTACNN